MQKKWSTILTVIVMLNIVSSCINPVKDFTQVESLPLIFPDYTSIVIPANIAPLNFFIEEEGSEFYVEIYASQGDRIKINQESPSIKIPNKKWRNLLDQNKGNSLNIDVYTKRDKWYKYATIIDTIAPETIDNNLVYRLISVVHTDGDKMGIYQQNLENFENSTIVDNTSDPKGPCINCHSFANNNPDKMTMHIRKGNNGTVIFDNGKYTKYNTRTENTIGPGGFTAWHPNGELIAFSLNTIFVYFTNDENKLVEVCDKSSDLVVYNVKTNKLSTSPKISGSNRENLPYWSPDGKTLYYISTTKSEKDLNTWVNARYDLLSIPFNPENMTWGQPDTLLSSKNTGKSITWPSVSPDGKHLLFCMIDHSYFSIFDTNSDLYLLNLETKDFHKLDVLNSPFTDSYHSWSKNGNWIVYSSKRLDELCTRPYFAYFDADGNFHKPFVLPQEDPLFYKNFRWHYNVPVLVDGKVNIDPVEMGAVLTQNPVGVNHDIPKHVDKVSTENHTDQSFY